MAQTDAQSIDRVFHALADATRRDIVQRTLSAELSISELAAEYDMTFPAIHKHVSVLEEAELVVKRAVGRERRIRANPASVRRAREVLSRFERLWQSRIERLDSVLAAPPSDSQPEPNNQRSQ